MSPDFSSKNQAWAAGSISAATISSTLALFVALGIREYWQQQSQTPMVLGALLALLEQWLRSFWVVYSHSQLRHTGQSLDLSTSLTRLHRFIDRMTSRDFTVLLLIARHYRRFELVSMGGSHRHPVILAVVVAVGTNRAQKIESNKMKVVKLIALLLGIGFIAWMIVTTGPEKIWREIFGLGDVGMAVFFCHISPLIFATVLAGNFVFCPRSISLYLKLFRARLAGEAINYTTTHRLFGRRAG